MNLIIDFLRLYRLYRRNGWSTRAALRIAKRRVTI
jgi:hypothetical protein